MMRALFAGVSGLRNHQTRMDVIGNNIANVNTVAFKASRVTFEEAFTQLLQGGSRAPANQGGVNPIQIGLGMNIGSVDQNFTQGNLENTGQATDLAIQGDAFFAVSSGTGQFYTRAGNFKLDASGRLVAPTNGFTVQGWNADPTGQIVSNSALDDIVLPFGQTTPARATERVSFAGNLDASAVPPGTVLVTSGVIYGIEQTTSNGGLGSDVNGLFAAGTANTQILGMTPSSTTVTVSDGTTTETYTYVSIDTGAGDKAFHSLNDLIAEINTDFATMTAALDNATGAIQLTAGGAPIVLDMSSTSSTLDQALAAANGSLAAAATSTTDEFSHTAVGTDALTILRDGTGSSLGLAGGQTILMDADKGGAPVTQGSLGVTGGTYNDLLNAIDNTLGLTNTTGTASTSAGAVSITGDGGLVNALTALNIRVSGGGAPVFDSIFNSQPGNYVQQQAAGDVVHNASITVFDSLGTPHTLQMTLTKDATTANRWTWAVTVPSPATVTAGTTGSVTFDADGRMQTFAYDGGATSFQFDPGTGATPPVDIEFDAGAPGSIVGLSQFAAPFSAVAQSQDGYTMGTLQDFSIDNGGVITGFFSNGVSQALAQIALVGFNNPSGLLRRGDNMYAAAGSSGAPVVGASGTSSQSSITSGALESSNVNLAEEFTSMIISQRGFQANARVITTADEMLSELTNLKR